MGALRRGEIQTNNKLYMSYGDLIIKMPRKNIVNLIETEQATLISEISSVPSTSYSKKQLDYSPLPFISENEDTVF